MRPGALEWCPIDDLMAVVVAIRVGAATVAVVDVAEGGVPDLDEGAIRRISAHVGVGKR